LRFSLCFLLFGKYFAILLCCQWYMLDPFDARIAGDARITTHLFGGNVLAPRGDHSDAIAALGVTGLRYPGGSLTEYMFDITNPNATELVDQRTGELRPVLPLDEFLAYAEAAEQPVTIVVPTRTQLTEAVDENGDRMPNINEAELRAFVAGVVATDAEIAAFEIGNEYWGIGMNAVEYGRVASEAAAIIDSELMAAGADDVNTIIQKGNNFGSSRISDEFAGVHADEVFAELNETYNTALNAHALFPSGEINWAFVNSKLVLSAFDDAEIQAVDGVVTHIYSRGPSSPHTKHFDLENAQATWLSEHPGLEIHITEWNLKSTSDLDRNDDYGLFQAAEMLELMEEFVVTGVDAAHVWPLNQNTRNALSNGFTFDEATAPGEMFALMSETLPGKALIDLNPETRDTEAQSGNVSAHMFAGEGELALYLINESRQSGTSASVDVSSFISGYDAADVVVLGVADGDAPGSNKSQAVIEEVDPSVISAGEIEASLDPGEIMQVVFAGVQPTDAFRPIWERASASDPVDDETPVPVVPPDEDDMGDDESASGVEWLLALLGVLSVAGGLG
jgi:hypothetical protein